MQEAAQALTASWQPRTEGPKLRGARLKDTSKTPHPVYAAQSFFSIYVHARPEFAGYPPSSIFYGREISPETDAQRFSHSLALVSLLLLEAALNDPAVENVHFVMVSEADVPLYNAGVLYLQLLNERRSRVGPSQSYKEFLNVDGVRPLPCCMLLQM